MSDTIRVTSEDFNLVPAETAQPTDRHSWIPHDIVELNRNPPAPPTIGAVLYPGKRTLLSGETEALKTWLALILCKAEMETERHVGWVDLDDMGAGAILQRLRAIGCPDKQISDFFLYYQPEQRLKDRCLEDVQTQISITGARLMVIDAFNPALSLHGLDPNSTPDIETFWREIADPICKEGAAVTMLDHVTKNVESRGKYAYGSERKASGATVHIGARLLVPFGIGRTGSAILDVHKDRPGYLPRPSLGVLELGSDGAQVTYELKPDRSHETGAFRPTILMERISRALETQHEPVSQTWVEDNVEGNDKAKRKALRTLVNDGHVTDIPGPRNSHGFITSKPYREAEEPASNDPGLTPANPGQIAGQFGVSSTPATSPGINRGRGAEPTTAEWPGTTPVNGNGNPNGDFGWLDELAPDPEDESIA